MTPAPQTTAAQRKHLAGVSPFPPPHRPSAADAAAATDANWPMCMSAPATDNRSTDSHHKTAHTATDAATCHTIHDPTATPVHIAATGDLGGMSQSRIAVRHRDWVTENRMRV